jgi:hypothetical protein
MNMTLATIINILLFIAICVMIILIFKKGDKPAPMTNVVQLPKSPYHDPRTTYRKKAIVEKVEPKHTGPINLLTYQRAASVPVVAKEPVVDMKMDKFDTRECKDCA